MNDLTVKYYFELREIFGINVVNFGSDEDAFVALIEKGMLKNNIDALEDRVNELEKDLREAETEVYKLENKNDNLDLDVMWLEEQLRDKKDEK